MFPWKILSLSSPNSFLVTSLELDSGGVTRQQRLEAPEKASKMENGIVPVSEFSGSSAVLIVPDLPNKEAQDTTPRSQNSSPPAPLPLHSPFKWDSHKTRRTPGSKRNRSQSICLGKTIKEKAREWVVSVPQVLGSWIQAVCEMELRLSLSLGFPLWVMSWAVNNVAHLLVLVGSASAEWVFCFLSQPSQAGMLTRKITLARDNPSFKVGLGTW